MMIKDADGNEHELAPGSLVERNGGGLFRVVTTFGLLGGEEASLIGAIDSLNLFLPASSLTLITSVPLTADDGKARTLSERRTSLLDNLKRARSGATNAFHALHRLVPRATYDESWFWQSVAESADSPRKISYAPRKEFFDVNSRRRKCSFAKFLRGPAKDNGLTLTDEEITLVCEEVGRTFPIDNDYTFDIVRGVDDVLAAYKPHWGSCMSEKSYTRWYGENPDKVGVVRILKGGLHVGRALVWTTDSGETVLDRVYPSDKGPHITAIHQWAESLGWDYKTRQCCTNGSLRSQRMDYFVTMKPASSGDYPYCDTFKYTDNDPESESLITLNTGSGEYCFNGTDGMYEGGPSRLTCEECGCDVDEDACEYRNDNAYCESCYSDMFVYVEYRLPSGTDREGSYCRDNTFCCEHCEEDRLNRDSDEVNVGNGIETWCLLCIHRGAYICAGCEKHFGDDQVELGGDAYCQDCADERCICEECGNCVLIADNEGCGEPEWVCDDCRNPVSAESAPAVETPAVPADWKYPISADYYCYCDDCKEVRRRRRDMFEMSRFFYEGCGCTPCRNESRERQEYVMAPYPNEREREAINRQREAEQPSLQLGEYFLEPITTTDQWMAEFEVTTSALQVFSLLP